MPRIMTEMIHISKPLHEKLHEIKPDEISGNKITFDDLISSMVYYLENDFKFIQKDFIDIIAEYKKIQIQMKVIQ